MSYDPVRERLLGGQRVILDGGVGTELERRGATMDRRAWCGPASAENAALLQEVHEAYIAAGAEVITANTYASSRIMLKAAGMADRTEEVNRIAVDAAQRARDGSQRPVALAGSLSHAVPIPPGTDRADRSFVPSEAEMEDAFTELALLLEEAGCDLLVLEMLYDPERIPAVFNAAKATSLPVWAGFSARRGPEGEVLSFDRGRDIPFTDVVTMMADHPVAAAGAMHTPSDLISGTLDALRASYRGPLIAYPDSGYFKMPHWQFEDIIAPRALADFARGWAEDHGVQVLGGCCGLGPEHIAALAPMRDAVGESGAERPGLSRVSPGL